MLRFYTEPTPSVHGTVSNEWFRQKARSAEMYCTDDADVTTIEMVLKKKEK
jgi:hypothetical protein